MISMIILLLVMAKEYWEEAPKANKKAENIALGKQLREAVAV